jgi:hypothetical protein
MRIGMPRDRVPGMSLSPSVCSLTSLPMVLNTFITKDFCSLTKLQKSLKLCSVRSMTVKIKARE